jgi:hypothetical protein
MFIVEDGTGLENSTSYVALDYASTYAESFFSEADYTTWSEASDASLERVLNRATMYLDSTYQFLGEKSTATQALQFPRAYLYDFKGDLISGVPNDIKKAVCLAAIRLLNGINMSPDLERGGKVIREKIDVIDISYSEGAPATTRFLEIDNLLKASGLISNNRNNTVNIPLTHR